MTDAMEGGGRAGDYPIENVPVATKQSGGRAPHVLTRMPNTAFGIPMGIAGNAILWRIIESAPRTFHLKNFAELLNISLWFCSAVVGCFIGIFYAIKIHSNFEHVKLELNHPVRIHFMNTPHLWWLMLSIGVPRVITTSQTFYQISFGIGLCFQTLWTQHIYDKWLFHPQRTISSAKPSFLLSTVGWFLLTNLGLLANIEEAWGLALPQFCLGIGIMFYLIVAFQVLISLHENESALKRSPSLALLLAPPSVGIIGIDSLDGKPDEFSTVAAMIFGWTLILFVIFAKVGPRIMQQPGVVGEYWAYVFPLSSVATAWTRYAYVTNTKSSLVVASFFIVVSVLALIVVGLRLLMHILACIRQRAQWGDPLLDLTSTLQSRTIGAK